MLSSYSAFVSMQTPVLCAIGLKYVCLHIYYLLQMKPSQKNQSGLGTTLTKHLMIQSRGWTMKEKGRERLEKTITG